MSEWDWELNLSSSHTVKHSYIKIKYSAVVVIQSHTHVFCLSRPAEAAHWCRQALMGCFQGQLTCAEATWPKETRKKRPNSVFLGLKHLAHCPKSTCKPPCALLLAPSSLQVATMGTHGPVAAHPPPAQRAAESRARLCCILGR